MSMYNPEIIGNTYGHDKTNEELMCAMRGGDYWQEREYSNDPDYDSVSNESLEFLVEKVLEN